MDDFAVDVGEAAVEAIVAEGEVFVIDSQKVKEGGVEVVDAGRVFCGCESKGIGGSIGCATSDSTTGHPIGEACLIVITAGAEDAFVDFGERCSPELSAENEQGVIEKTSLTEVEEETGEGLIYSNGFAPVIIGEGSM